MEESSAAHLYNIIFIRDIFFRYMSFRKFSYCKLAGQVKVKVGVLHPVQQPGSYWDRSTVLQIVGLERTGVAAYD